MDSSSILAYGLESRSRFVSYFPPMVYKKDIWWLDSLAYTIEGHTLEGAEKIEK